LPLEKSLCSFSWVGRHGRTVRLYSCCHLESFGYARGKLCEGSGRVSFVLGALKGTGVYYIILLLDSSFLVGHLCDDWSFCDAGQK
jgi:hypothetical protein